MDEAGLWRRVHVAVLDEFGVHGEIDWSRAILYGASVRARTRGELTGLNPVDRGRPGSKIHLLSDANGPPLVVGITAANTHDSAMFIPLPMRTMPPQAGQDPRR